MNAHEHVRYYTRSTQPIKMSNYFITGLAHCPLSSYLVVNFLFSTDEIFVEFAIKYMVKE